MQYIPEYVLMKNDVNDLENKVTAALSNWFCVLHVHHEIIAYERFFSYGLCSPINNNKKHSYNRLQQYSFIHEMS